MKLTKYTHACVKLEKDGKVLLVDPGSFTEDAAFEGVDAILVTHEHPDHLDVERVKSIDAPIWTNSDVAGQLGELGERVQVVADGDVFEAAGFAVRAYGRDHAVILPELGVPCQNVGYLIEDAVYHPGDSFTLPGRKVHTNLVPISGPWFSLPPAVEYARAVDAQQTVGIHDALLSPIGQGMLKRFLDGQGDRPYQQLAPGTTVEVN
ncbi:MBL fold metallo-hydrolase [Kribbella sp. CA-293567]|uniref:MBL fold metallo-hydrolase n=1 Tax=Kribbella sp. CA-293567 TaxID=3002436 RepID=UPI0022DE85C9|nr:MBL fold metallo-hydrolase [Kribbella sp. CA-293567]WBQ06236.1 MBL fold metallo-hydrolase [Kribbella sp. CA-293567]